MATSGYEVVVIGGGLAGCEAALTLADAGVRVRLVEQKPLRRSPAHQSDGLAELVCSNSLRSDNPENAVGLLHEELRRLGSPILEAADAARVPAGDALAVDRVVFGGRLTARLDAHPNVERAGEEALALPEGPALALVCTGPLTGASLAADLAAATGAGQLAFYDAIAPIVTAESVDQSIAFAASRYGKGGGADYLNLPMNREEYERFVAEVVRAEKVVPHGFEELHYFEGCLPIEVMAERGPETLRFGPMKPVGLDDPRTGRWPHAVIQLRKEDVGGTAYNLVGFQTRLTWPEQKRIFKGFVPGLANAEFLRLGQVHRNTFVNAPKVLGPDLSLRARPHVFLAGQITGVEGYVESAACGHLAAGAVLARLHGSPWIPPPAGTMLGGLYRHVTGEAHPADYRYQPTNVVWALVPPPEADGAKVRKDQRKAWLVSRARAQLSAWAPRALPPPAPRERAAVAS